MAEPICNSSRLIIEFEAIETVEELNARAPKLHNFIQTVTGLTKRFQFLDINTSSRPNAKPGPNAQLVNVNDKHEIQALFTRQQHRAVQEIVLGPTTICNISQKKVEKRYTRLLTDIPISKITKLPVYIWKNPEVEEHSNIEITKPFSTVEIRRKLIIKMNDPLANSRTVGLDKIKYWDLFSADRSGLLLQAFFNACLRVQAIPDIWKKMYSVLVKKSRDLDSNELRNFHTVTMINSIAKLFQSLITARLIVWAKKNKRLSPTQKGLISYDAACESSFILQECQDYAANNKLDLAVAWLDFSTASDSIPQSAVAYALTKHSVPEPIKNLILNSIKNAETKIRLMYSDAGFTRPIKILRGLPQGYAINPILIDLLLEPILRLLTADSYNAFQLFSSKINHFAIPNELVLIASKAEKLQALLSLVEDVAQKIGLQFEINNCSTYHYDGKLNDVRDTEFLFFDKKLTALSKEKMTDYFGVRQGLSIGQSGIPTVEEMIESVNSVSDSQLNCYQKNEAIQNFIMPRAENCLKGLKHFDKESIENIDRMLQAKFKSWLSIPEDASTESIVFQCAKLNKKTRISSYLPLMDLYCIMKITNAFNMLTSEDDTVRLIALDSVTAEVREKLEIKSRNGRPMLSITQFLSGVRPDVHRENDTTWGMVRNATIQLKRKVNFSWVYDTTSKKIQILLRRSKKVKVTLEKSWSADISFDLKAALSNHYVNEAKRKNADIKNHELRRESKDEPKPVHEPKPDHEPKPVDEPKPDHEPSPMDVDQQNSPIAEEDPSNVVEVPNHQSTATI